MTKLRKITTKVLLWLFILIPVAVLAHFILFPQQTRTILIDYAGFKKEGRLYFNRNTPPGRVDTIKHLIQLASARAAAFWGRQTCDPAYIYCSSDEDFKKFGSPYPVPAITHLKAGERIVISSAGAGLDIIAHELSHAEFYERIGFYNWTFKIPTWFDEGLAMQNDYRDYYSEDTLKAKSYNYKRLPDVRKLISAKQFNEGTLDEVMLHYMTAKHEVKNWYTKERLDRLIKDINAGKPFSKAFGQ